MHGTARAAPRLAGRWLRHWLEVGAFKVADIIAILLDLHQEVVSKQLEVRVRPKEAFAMGDVVGDVENGVGCQMMQLTPVGEQKPTHKAVQLERQTSTKELLVQHSLVPAGGRMATAPAVLH